MATLMGIINLTPDSFHTPSRAAAGDVPALLGRMSADGFGIADIGAVSTRPGAAAVTVEEEWCRLAPALELIAAPSSRCGLRISIDTTSSEIVRRTQALLGDFIVNDISAGEDDPEMLPTVGALGLDYVAMHKRGNPRTMDKLCQYPDGIMAELISYFEGFSVRASAAGIGNWILDPGLGFAKTAEQCWEILRNLRRLKRFGRPILTGAADKRFTAGSSPGRAERMALAAGADILRIHI